MQMTTNTTTEFSKIKITIADIISQSIGKTEIFLSTNSLNNLAIHLAIAIVRIQSNTYIPLSSSQISVFKDERNYMYAQDLCNTLSTIFHVEFPENEIGLVTMYLSKSQLLDMEINSGFDLLDVEVFNILRETMFIINKQYNHDFRTNDKLFVSIGLHLTPAIERLENNQQLENALTAQIKERHPVEFAYASILNTVIQKQYQASFIDDELAFIALHFVVATLKKG